MSKLGGADDASPCAGTLGSICPHFCRTTETNAAFLMLKNAMYTDDREVVAQDGRAASALSRIGFDIYYYTPMICRLWLKMDS